MFKSLRGALRFPALLRSYVGEPSAGVRVYADPVVIMVKPDTKNVEVMTSRGASIESRSIFYVDGSVNVKEQDKIIFEMLQSNWHGKVFADTAERDDYFATYPNKLAINKTWCVVDGVPWIYGDAGWTDSFVWSGRIDGEHREFFEGRQDTITSVSRDYDGFGWADDAEDDDGLSIQEIQI